MVVLPAAARPPQTFLELSMEVCPLSTIVTLPTGGISAPSGGVSVPRWYVQS